MGFQNANENEAHGFENLVIWRWKSFGKVMEIFLKEDKGHDENHSQSKHSIFNHIFNNNRHYQVLLQIHSERLANP